MNPIAILTSTYTSACQACTLVGGIADTPTWTTIAGCATPTPMSSCTLQNEDPACLPISVGAGLHRPYIKEDIVEILQNLSHIKKVSSYPAIKPGIETGLPRMVHIVLPNQGVVAQGCICGSTTVPVLNVTSATWFCKISFDIHNVLIIHSLSSLVFSQ